MMEDLVRVDVLDGWMPLSAVAEYLGITRPAAGRAVIRHKMARRQFGHVVVVDRAAVLRYEAERQHSGPPARGPRRRGP